MKKVESNRKAVTLRRSAGGSALQPSHVGESPYASFLSRFLRELNNRRISYCVLRNFEGLPATFDDDIDILVDREDLEKIEGAITELMEGFILLRRIERNGHLQFYIGSGGEMKQAIVKNRPAQVIELDFVTQLQWKGMAYLSTEDVLSNRKQHGEFCVAAPAHHAAHLACHAILDKNFVKDEYKEVIARFISTEGETGFNALSSYIGNRMVKRLLLAFREGNGAAAILDLRKPLIASLMYHRIGSIPSCILFWTRKFFRIIRAILHPTGVLIATAGPDGAGKSTLLNRLGTVLSDSFVPIKEQYMGWKQFVLPTKRILFYIQGVLQCSGDGKAAKGNAGRKMHPPWTHNFSVLHYFLDLWARYIFLIRPVMARGGMVLCDRYFYDIFVQKVWICTNSLTRRLFLAFIPKPSVSILFTGNPTIIAGRKQENSAEETKKQLEALSFLKDTSSNVLEIEATDKLTHNAASVVHFLFQ